MGESAYYIDLDWTHLGVEVLFQTFVNGSEKDVGDNGHDCQGMRER